MPPWQTRIYEKCLAGVVDDFARFGKVAVDGGMEHCESDVVGNGL